MASKLPFPSICLLPAHLSAAERQRLEAQIPTLARVSQRAEVFVGKISRKERARFELRRLGISTEDEPEEEAEEEPEAASAAARPRTPPGSSGRAAKRRKTGQQNSSPIVISSGSEDEGPSSQFPASQATVPVKASQSESSPLATVKVVKLAWFTDSLACRKVLPFSGYVVYEGRRLPDKEMALQASSSFLESQSQTQSQSQSQSQPLSLPWSQPKAPQPKTISKAEGILQRAQADAAEAGSPVSPNRPKSSPLPQPRQHTSPSRRKTFHTTANPPSLVRKTTSENDDPQTLPPIPEYLHTTYSCQRPTPVHPPNEAFVDILKTIRVTRQLMGDKIGVRAYSSAIASLAAYPYKLGVPAEVARLPGCGPKFAELFREYDDTAGHIHEAEDAEKDPKLSVLRLFYNIWGVAESTARAFYNRGWRDLDDVVEYGWPELTRVQQIGVKYYDELQELMTRGEVETIAGRVLDHANKIDPGFQMLIAGGYRRGKEMSGDVDIILSHPDESVTHHVIGSLIFALEEAGLVTHTLTVSTTNSDRGQEPVSWKGIAPRQAMASSSDAAPSGGLGFDTLDKALVVWQEPLEEGDTTNTGLGAPNIPKANTNPHRRVDIIVTPWKTVGCAVLGWSGGTTFQRDLRRYCKHAKGLKFDSSGARSQTDGSWVDLEDFTNDPAPDMLSAERRVFAALDLEWRAPDERCTG